MYTKRKQTHQTYWYKSWKLKRTNPTYNTHDSPSAGMKMGSTVKSLYTKKNVTKAKRQKEDGEFTKATGMNECYIHGLQRYEVIVKREQKGAKILP